jgi:hypothetical protein
MSSRIFRKPGVKVRVLNGLDYCNLIGFGVRGGSLIGSDVRNAVQTPLASAAFITPNLELSVNRRYRISAATHAIRDFRESHIAPTEQRHYSLNFTFGKVSSL